ncbi:amidohydrolase [Specibacter cremeus]|uniref:amidohydrolase n=1 Tax=Specibacter cremeus TaxID=1629051 RepID=UPI000F7B44D2|nr:amidohydrolase [Specibacter cremeus]
MTADLLIHSARIFDGRTLLGDATAVAVADGVITAVGSTRDLLSSHGDAARVLDAGGNLLCPSFTDAHVHPIMGGYEMGQCDLSGAADADACLALIGAYATANPDLDWISGGGWRMPHFDGGNPTADLLERVAPDRAVYLINADHHGAWVSPEALRRAGITAATPDPADGRIDRDADGRPTGTLQEGAMDLVGSLLPAPTDGQYTAALHRAQAYLHTLGITGWQDAIVGAYAGHRDTTDTYLAAQADGSLDARVTGALWLDRGLTLDGVQDAVAALVARRERIAAAPSGPRGRFTANTIKIMVDGVAESETAALKEPYLDRCGHAGDHSGTSHFAPEVLTAVVRALALAGFQLHFHTIGDRALAEALDALEAARDAGDDGAARHHIAHLQLVDPADVARMAALGVTANLQALWACNDDAMTELTVPILGAERAGHQYPFGDFLRAGLPLAMGSDWPVSTPDPWQAIHVAVNRTPPGKDSAAPLLPAQALTLGQALAAYTSGSARVTHHDDAGGIAPGRRADIVVLDADPFALPARRLCEVAARMTVFAGKVVYAKE